MTDSVSVADAVPVADAATVAAFAGNPEAGLSVMFAVMDAALVRLAADRPVVLAIDDAQWLDPATRAWLRPVGRRLVDVPLLVLAAQRVGEGAPVDGGAVLRLDPLDDAAARSAGRCSASGAG